MCGWLHHSDAQRHPTGRSVPTLWLRSAPGEDWPRPTTAILTRRPRHLSRSVMFRHLFSGRDRVGVRNRCFCSGPPPGTIRELSGSSASTTRASASSISGTKPPAESTPADAAGVMRFAKFLDENFVEAAGVEQRLSVSHPCRGASGRAGRRLPPQTRLAAPPHQPTASIVHRHARCTQITEPAAKGFVSASLQTRSQKTPQDPANNCFTYRINCESRTKFDFRSFRGRELVRPCVFQGRLVFTHAWFRGRRLETPAHDFGAETQCFPR